MAHKGNAKFLVATPNAMTAGPIILATGEPVMAMGGFLGSDPILTQQDLAALVSAGTVRFFLTQGARPGGGEDLTGWISAHCSAVPSSEWSSAGSNNTGEPGSGGGGAGQQLYDCGSTH